MQTETLINSKMQDFPESFKKEVLAFVESLSQKIKKTEKPKKRQFGSSPGMFKMAADFDAPLEDFKDYM